MLTTSPAGDLVSFDSTIIYKDETTMLDVELTCGGGAACKDYMEATLQPLSCAGSAPVTFLMGQETWVLAAQQVQLLYPRGSVDVLRCMKQCLPSFYGRCRASVAVPPL